MGSSWDLLTAAADVDAWMARNGFKPTDYSPASEWTLPCLIAPTFDSLGNPSWLIVDLADARKLIDAWVSSGAYDDD